MQLHQARIPDKAYYENHIAIENIDRLNTANFFNILDTDWKNKLNNLFIDICKDVVKESFDKNGKEAGAIINTFKKQYAICEAKYWGKILFSEYDQYNKIIEESNKYECMLIHNHNDSDYFSVVDIDNFLRDEKLHTVVVITSNMNIFILYKEIDRDYSNVEEYIEENVIFNAITPDLMEVLEKNGLNIRRITL